jgi:predicted secreted protein
MTLLSGIFVYVLIWWVVLFAVLPWGVRIPDQPEAGHASSAPVHPHLVAKMIATSIVSLVLWLGVYYVMSNGLISFRPQ